MKKKQQRISSSITKSTTTTTITKEFRDHPTTTKSELEEEQAQDRLLAKGPIRKVSIPGHEQYSEDRYTLEKELLVMIVNKSWVETLDTTFSKLMCHLIC